MTLDAATRAVHAGTAPDRETGGLNTPIISSTAFDYVNQDQVRYPRYFNTLNGGVVEAKTAALEHTEDALLLSSGLAAIASIFCAFLQQGDHVVLLEGIYGGTQDLAENLLPKLGVTFSVSNAEQLPDNLTSTTRMIWLESPTNPLLRVVDLEPVAELARSKDILTVIDNTFASPILQQPHRLGIDLVMHSATKYLGGHSDLCLGLVAGSNEHINVIRQQAVRLGGSVNAQTASLLERSMKTLALRVERQSANALDLAGRLGRHPAIGAVIYPGLADHPDHAIARRQMSAFGGMLAFRLAKTQSVEGFLQRLQLIQPAVSLGGVESTICQPSQTSHAKLSDQARSELGIDDRLMRLSVGIEAVDDLAADINQALGLQLA